MIFLSPGNTKLGHIPNFSITAIKTCPGHTNFCVKKCYGRKFEYLRKNCKSAYQLNHEISKKSNFHDLMIKEINNINTKYFRIHGVSGDFYSSNYIKQWIKIVSSLPNVKFYSYTRSYRIIKLLPYLEELKKLKNVTLFASVDNHINISEIPKNWRIAWLETDNRKKGEFCIEQTKDIKCEQCKYCFNGKKQGDVIFLIH